MTPSSSASTQNHTSPVNYLKTIYTFESENKTASVFFEFLESKSGDITNDYMRAVCFQASKMDLFPDNKRIPIEAKKGFCFGFISKKGETILQLIKNVEYAMTWCNPATYEVPLIPITASMLEDSLHKMPAKDYSDVFCSNYSDQWS